jgi:hypothetical protein
VLKAGDVFAGSYPPYSGKKRRFIALTDEEAGRCTVVWVYTSTNMEDRSCVLSPGDHPLITKTCVVVYEQAVIAQAANIRSAIDAGALSVQAPLPVFVLKRALDGLFASELTPVEVLDYCADR